MKKFSYSMQNILEIKQKMEAQEKVNFQIAASALSIEQKKLESLEQKRDSYEELLRESLCSSLKLLTIKEQRDAIETIKFMVRQQKNAVRKAEHQLELARKRLDEAMKERKIHEKLKENALDEYKREYERQEQKEVDERISFQYASKEGRNS